MSRLLTAAVVTLLAVLPAYAQKRPVTVDDVLGMKAVGSPMVSPDGTRVIYTVRQWESEKDRMESRTRIWMVPVAGGASRQITFGERGDSQPQWSPDGRYISFVSARGASTGDDPPRGQLYLMRADGGEAWKLTDAKESIASYSWAPDSTRVAFVSTDARSSDDESNVRKRDDERVFEGDFRYQHVWVMAVDGKTPGRAHHERDELHRHRRALMVAGQQADGVQREADDDDSRRPLGRLRRRRRRRHDREDHDQPGFRRRT